MAGWRAGQYSPPVALLGMACTGALTALDLLRLDTGPLGIAPLGFCLAGAAALLRQRAERLTRPAPSHAR